MSQRTAKSKLHQKLSTPSMQWILPIAIFTLAVTLRIIFLYQLRATPFFSNLFSDSQIYHTLAWQIQHGELSLRSFFMSPLYPYFIAIIHTLFGNEFFWVRFFQCVVGSVMAVVIYIIGKKIFGSIEGFAAGIIAASYSMFIFYDNSILIESLQALLLVLFYWSAIHLFEKGRKRDGIIFGAVGGLMIVMRASFILVLFAVLLYYIILEKKRSQKQKALNIIISITSVFIMILPWTIRNYSAEKDFVLITSSAGYNFYAGNNERSTGEYFIPENIDISIDPNGHSFVEKTVGQKLHSSDVSAYWFHKSFQWIANYPFDFLKLFGKKMILFWNAAEIDQLGLSYDFFKNEYNTILDFPFPSFLFVATFAAIGFTFSIRRKVKETSITMLVLMIGSYLVSIALFFVNGRFRVPVTPLLILLASCGIVQFFTALYREQWREIIYAGISAAVVLVFMTVGNFQVGQSFSEEYNKLGMISFDAKKYSEAQTYYQKALASGDNTRIRLNLANAFAAAGMYQDADQEYQTVIESSPHNALAYFNFGNFALQVNQPKQAYLLWLRAIKEDTTLAPAYKNIAVLMSQTGKYDEAITKFEQYLLYEHDPRQRSTAQQDIENLRQLLSSAK